MIQNQRNLIIFLQKVTKMDVSDWHIADICVCIVLGILWFILSDLNPHHLFVPENDSLSSFPYKNTGMGGGTNLTLILAVPTVIYLVIYFIEKYASDVKYVSPFDLIELLCCHYGCVLFAGNICHVLKIYVGRPRPDYYDFIENHIPEEPKAHEHELREAFKSFPSGHSCTSASGSLFCTLILFKLITANDVWCICLKCLPLIYAFYIGSMRILEYRHHTDDVLAGFIIGFLFAIIFFIAASTHIFVRLRP